MTRWLARPDPRALLVLLVCAASVALLHKNAHSPRPPTPERAARRAELSLQEEQRNRQEIDTQIDSMQARFAAKQEAVAGLLEGKDTARETLRRFREIGSSLSVKDEQLTEETLLRDILIHAEIRLEGRPEAAISSAVATVRRQIKAYRPSVVLPAD